MTPSATYTWMYPTNKEGPAVHWMRCFGYQAACSSSITHRNNQLSIVHLSCLSLEHMLVETNKVTYLLTISSRCSFLKASQMQHIGHECVVLATELVREADGRTDGRTECGREGWREGEREGERERVRE